MSCFLWRFLFMTVTIHFSTYRHCTVCCYVMGLLFYAELIYTPFCNGIFLCAFLFCLGPCLFSALTSGSNAKWDVIPKHNEVPVTACQPATWLRWHLLWVYPSGTESHREKRLICRTVWIKHRTTLCTAETSSFSRLLMFKWVSNIVRSFKKSEACQWWKKRNLLHWFSSVIVTITLITCHY